MTDCGRQLREIMAIIAHSCVIAVFGSGCVEINRIEKWHRRKRDGQ